VSGDSNCDNQQTKPTASKDKQCAQAHGPPPADVNDRHWTNAKVTEIQSAAMDVCLSERSAQLADAKGVPKEGRRKANPRGIKDESLDHDFYVVVEARSSDMSAIRSTRRGASSTSHPFGRSERSSPVRAWP
jgi:hypothetical protein